ncbi:glucuronate isomerase [Raineyella antarctica]|nr:glucuronate isomerase [Raineyella antarctica]
MPEPMMELHPDRLLPPDPGVRDIARRLYQSVQDLPIISPHGHVPPQWMADDINFEDPTSLLITPDHYVNRLMHAHGVELSTLGVNQKDFTADQKREAFRTLCSMWPIYRGTPVKYWFEHTFSEVFGITQVPSAATADAIYDQIDAAIKTPEFSVRSLYRKFNIEVMATTDDPCDDLHWHQQLIDDPTWDGRVLPAFRPDKYLEPARPDWNESTDRLAEVSGEDTSTWQGWVAAMENRRAYFKAHGATSTDHSHSDAGTEVLPVTEAERIYLAARAGTASVEECTALRRHMVTEQARMACDDGLTMTIHPAVVRNHDPEAFESYGADVGADIPHAVEFSRALQPMLSRYGNHPNFTFVAFTMDETVYNRELGPLAGYYRSVYVGAPWWFIDAPESISRFRDNVTTSAGLLKTSGFIDDTRAFCSIPARHDMSRRLDAGFLANLVAVHRLTEDEAVEGIHDLVVTCPRKAFKL